jgi:HAD superfamily hydrolase (TIGR01509 family)
MMRAQHTSDQVNTLIFDLFGVVIAFDDAPVYKRLAAHCTVPDEALAALQDLVSRPDLIRGRLSLDDLREELAKSLGLRVTASEFKAIWREPYTAAVDGMDKLLKSLSNSHRLVLLSNVDRYYWSEVQVLHPEVRHFHARVLSWEQAVAKPERVSFERALVAAEAAAPNCFFIDDKAENIEAALGCGIRGHLFRGMEGLKASLLSEGIAC